VAERVFDPGDTIITPDNIHASQRRHEAMKAMQNGTATPEQYKLVNDADKAMAEAMTLRRK
jgi:hypothetical protein